MVTPRRAPRRHPLASPRGRLRAAQRLAGGLRPAALARVERATEGAVDALLARPDFQKLLAACQALEALPEAERLARLEGLAWFVLEQALAEGDWRCAEFVLTERRLGRNPAQTLARRAVARQRRAAKPPAAEARAVGPAAIEAPASRTGGATPYHDPAARVVARAGAALRDAVVHEHALRHAVEAADVEPEVSAEADPHPSPPPPAAGEGAGRRLTDRAPSPAQRGRVGVWASDPHTGSGEVPAATATPPAPRPRRLDGLAARLRSGTASCTAEPRHVPVKGLLRAWAQGP